MPKPEIVKRVHCPTCGDAAEVRRRQGKYKQLDLKCPNCGVLNYQTSAGQARLNSLADIDMTPRPDLEQAHTNKPEYTGIRSTFFE